MSSGGQKVLNKNQLFKRNKKRNARIIRAQAIDDKINKQNNDLSEETGGILNVDNFVMTRSFEIQQLQLSMKDSKNSNSTRVFQALPRNLRRRTASHNVKRIPKRMRNRAKREMQKNTVSQNTGDASVQKKSKLTSKELYKAKRMVSLLRLASKAREMKALLDATTEESSMRQKMKYLAKVIRSNKRNSKFGKLNNSMGSYDNTGVNRLQKVHHHKIKYLKRQKSFAWLTTHVWHAKRAHMIKRWGYQIPYSPTQKCYKLTHRLGNTISSSDGALCMDSSYNGIMIVSVDTNDTPVIENLVNLLTNSKANSIKYLNKMYWFQGMMYLNSSIKGPLELCWVKNNKILVRIHPSLYEQCFFAITNLDEKLKVEDCRYSIGSITITGSKSLIALSSVIRTNVNDKSTISKSFEQFQKVSKLSDYSSLPRRTIFAFEMIDPRFLNSPQSLQQNSTLNGDDVLDIQNNFPVEEVRTIFEKLTESTERNKSYNNQSTLKELAKRRRLMFASRVENQLPVNNSTDPVIPTVIIKRHKTNDWVVLLPWHWVLPLWYQLNRVSRVNLMGLRQLQQLSYENRRLYFPNDYPFTDAGYQEATIFNRLSIKKKWDQKPKSKKVNFTSITNLHETNLPAIKGEIGDYFSCDWKFLQILRNGLLFLTEKNNVLTLINSDKTGSFDDKTGIREVTVVNDILELYKDLALNANEADSNNVDLPVCLATRKNAALPTFTDTTSIIESPLAIIPVSCDLMEKGHPKDNARIYSIPKKDIDHWRKIANGTLRSDGKRNHQLDHPLPNVTDLIGFVTSATFHLSEGKGVANGFVDANAIKACQDNLILIRNVGTDSYRVARWTPIKL